MFNVGKWYSSRKQLTFSLPQGSFAGPSLYSVYASTILERVLHNLEIHGYAEDHAIQASFVSGSEPEKLITCTAPEETMLNMKDWMNINRLEMDDSKNEFIMFASQQQLMKSTKVDYHKTKCEQHPSKGVRFHKEYWNSPR